MKTLRWGGLLALLLVAACVGRIEEIPLRDGAIDDRVSDATGDQSSDTAHTDASPEAGCSAALTSCGGRCVDVTRDNANCGACGHSCAGGTSCSSGMCRSTCATGETACGTPAACVNEQSDPANCGACGHACATGQVCNAGACGTTCSGTMCGAACVDLQTDPSHCGACGTACTTGQSCTTGHCACSTGLASCGAACVDTATDGANCGSCGHACGTGQTCVSGACACAASQTLCGSSCVSTASDPANCGSCGHACAAGQVCGAGACASTCAMTMCGSACVNLQTDAMHCGACATACPSGQSCVTGACSVVCAAGQMNCGGTCVNTATSMTNCGSCGHACVAGQTCVGSACACGAGTILCGSACVNTASDTANCGSCGHACTSAQSCMSGTCVTPSACPGPPAGVTADQTAALNLENQVRTAMGIPCATMVTTANLSATRHCGYYVADHSMAACIANPHVEVSTCAMFVAANFWDRMTAAGYAGSPAFEDMAFVGNGASATQQWIDTIWHRTPILSPWVRDIGYGSGTGCDTMDFGTGAATPSTVVATYPYANQTGVPTSFNGLYEGPMPPAPPAGWPSGYPIHIYAQGGSIATHVLTLTGSSTPIAHMYIGSSDAAAMGLLPNANVMYANVPLTAATQYHVHVTGTNSAGPITLDWNFTTR